MARRSRTRWHNKPASGRVPLEEANSKPPNLEPGVVIIYFAGRSLENCAQTFRARAGIYGLRVVGESRELRLGWRVGVFRGDGGEVANKVYTAKPKLQETRRPECESLIA